MVKRLEAVAEFSIKTLLQKHPERLLPEKSYVPAPVPTTAVPHQVY